MPSLISRFLGKRKIVDPTPLLDGEKYEAVPKTPSPSTPTFPDLAQSPKSPSKPAPKQQQSDKSLVFSIRRKPASSHGTSPESKSTHIVPILSLNLPDTRQDERKLHGLGVVFELTDGPSGLDDVALGEKRLTATQTLTLVQNTAEVICEQGLEKLGVMRPHWFASPRQQETQLRLINRFLQTLSPYGTNGVTPTDTPSPSTFESELRYTRDPHDVAAVLRWGLRHLELDGNTFAASAEVDWYRSFVDSERSASYPSQAFDDILVPLLPDVHSQLLRATLDLVSSLAAHSEENGISGNKLSKVLGWWILSSRNVRGMEWREFYLQWEVAARQFEHLFLAYIRAQAAQSRMPKRLTELVKNYPFEKNRREDDGIFLPRSRFSTRSARALFVKVSVDAPGVAAHPHPLRIVEDAFKADAESESSGHVPTLWQDLRKAASNSTKSGGGTDADGEEAAESLDLAAIFADETIRLLSLVSTPNDAAGAPLSMFTPLPTGRGRRSLSVSDVSYATGLTNGTVQGSSKDATSSPDKLKASAAVSSPELDVATDWQAFSSAGFRSPSGLSLAASLWDNDTEVTQPPLKKSSAGKRNLSSKSGSPRPASVDSPVHTQPAAPPPPSRIVHGIPQLVKLDEAFVDFWADTLLDTIARTWPTFVVCQLKSTSNFRLSENDEPIQWLVIERTMVEPVRSLPNQIKASGTSDRVAAATPGSPTRSEASRSSRWTASSLAAARKRWSLFSSRNESAPGISGGKGLTARKAAKDAKVGELGEILREEDERNFNGVKVNGAPAPKETEGLIEDTEKADVSLPPVTSNIGISESAELATAGEDTVVSKDAEPTTAVVDSHSLQAGNAVGALPEATETTAEAADVKDEVQTHDIGTISESQPAENDMTQPQNLVARMVGEPEPTEANRIIREEQATNHINSKAEGSVVATEDASVEPEAGFSTEDAPTPDDSQAPLPSVVLEGDIAEQHPTSHPSTANAASAGLHTDMKVNTPSVDNSRRSELDIGHSEAVHTPTPEEMIEEMKTKLSMPSGARTSAVAAQEHDEPPIDHPPEETPAKMSIPQDKTLDDTTDPGSIVLTGISADIGAGSNADA